jgi:hypothetical protein
VYSGKVFSGTDLPILPQEFPKNFRSLLEHCWAADPAARPSFEAIVSAFLRNDIFLSLPYSDVIRIHQYQSKILQPSFAVQTIVSLIDQIEVLKKSNLQLQQKVDELNRAVVGIASTPLDSVPRPRRLSRHQLNIVQTLEGPGDWTPAPEISGREDQDSMAGIPEAPTSGRMLAPLSIRSVQSQDLVGNRRYSMKFPIPQGVVELDRGVRAAEAPVTDSKKAEPVKGQPVSPPAIATAGSVPLAAARGVQTAISKGRLGMPPQPSLAAFSLTRMANAQFVSVPSSQFPEGLFSHMNAECEGNCALAGMVMISGNSVDHDRDAEIHEVVNFEWTKCWASENVPNSWIQFDFGNRKVMATCYAIKTYPCRAGYSHLKSWIVEGCDAGSQEWTEMDIRTDTNELNGKSKIVVFQCQNVVECQIIRLRQTGPNHYGDDYLMLTNIEFLGDIS